MEMFSENVNMIKFFIPFLSLVEITKYLIIYLFVNSKFKYLKISEITYLNDYYFLFLRINK